MYQLYSIYEITNSKIINCQKNRYIYIPLNIAGELSIGQGDSMTVTLRDKLEKKLTKNFVLFSEIFFQIFDFLNLKNIFSG